MSRLVPPSTQQAERLRGFFAAAGYTQERVAEVLGTVMPPPVSHHQHGQLLQRVSEPVPFDLITRCLFLGTAVEERVAREVLPGEVLAVALDCGLLYLDGERLRPLAVLSPYEGLWIAADLDQQRDSDTAAEHVLPVNQPAMHLLRFAVQRPVHAVLDLCSGNALHALAASRFSERVVASDLSPRARMFAEFNAALNGRPALECLTGDLFAPVQGRRFDLILCNPPFIVSPATEFLYRDNALELDGFCRQVIREAPAYLSEGGYCQVICEWVELRGQPWQGRLRGWFEGIGCDAWVLEGSRQLPATYVLERGREFRLADPDADAQRNREWVEYLISRQVEAIHGGVITLRRRTGENWISLGELSRDVVEPIGEAIEQGFASRDFLRANAVDEMLLAARPRVSPVLRIEQASAWSGGRWRTESMLLKVSSGVPVSIGIDENIRDAIAGFDGRRTVADVLVGLAERVAAPPDAVRGQFLHVVRLLIEHACLLPPA